MLQLDHENLKTLKAFEDFYTKFNMIEGSNGYTFQVGYPDELTSTEFLDKLYSLLNLNEKDGLYQMQKKMKRYSDLLSQEGKNLILMDGVSEIGKEIFGKNQIKSELFKFFEEFPYYKERKYGIFFNIKDIFYPLFHPDRPYFINFAFLGYYNINYNINYLRYVEKFGTEQNLPGFLMTNVQMVEVIKCQYHCYKNQNYNSSFGHSPSRSIFNCQEKPEYDYDYS